MLNKKSSIDAFKELIEIQIILVNTFEDQEKPINNVNIRLPEVLIMLDHIYIALNFIFVLFCFLKIDKIKDNIFVKGFLIGILFFID